MKKLFQSLSIIGLLTLAVSCEKDEGKLPDISFKTGGSYVSSDATVNKGSKVLMGIDASKSEKKDVLKKFNISKSLNGAALISVYDQDLSGGDGDNFSYDYTASVDSVAGKTAQYIFTVTNRDGLTNQVALTLTSK